MGINKDIWDEAELMAQNQQSVKSSENYLGEEYAANLVEAVESKILAGKRFSDQDKQNLISLLSYFEESRAIVLMSELESISPNLLPQIFEVINESDARSAPKALEFAKKIMRNYRKSVLPRVFSKERLSLALKEIKKDI